MTRLWDKGQEFDERVLRYTAGEDHLLDNRLVAYDVRASIAHATMLHERGFLDEHDLAAVSDGLQQLAREHAQGEWRVQLEDEDVHTALETRLTHAVGPAGARVHLGRSRNDQVLAALRLYLTDAAAGLAEAADRVAEVLDGLAKQEGDTPLPGYTHTQHAMPSSVSLWAGGFASELRDDATAVRATRRRVSKNPLGSAAGYGVPAVDLDRASTCQKLDFDEIQEPVTAVQLSRGKAEAELTFQIVLLMQDLGRLASDLILFYTPEFAYVTLPDRLTTGSSIMPQKRNPDVLELVRARGATVSACLTEILGVTTKLTSGYHRDLQLIKAPLFKAIDVADDTLNVMAHTLADIRFIPENIRMTDDLYATERAYKLVRDEGIPFRDAYRRVAAELHKDD